MEFVQKKNPEIDLFDFTSFFGLDFFKFSGPLYEFIPIALKVFITAALSDISVCNLDTNTNTIQSKKIKLAHTDTIQGIL